MEHLTVKTSRFGRRFEMRRRKNFGWEWTEWQNKSETSYTGSTLHLDLDNGTGKVEDHYNTSRWSEITFEREETDFTNIRKINLLESLFRLFRRIRILATWVCVVFFIIAIFSNDFLKVFAYTFLAVVISFIIATIFYYWGKHAVKKGRK